MSEIRDELALLEAHYDTTFDLGTPRQYTQHGGWNQSCACGHGLGDAGGDNGEERVAAAHRAHLAEALAVYVAGKQAEAVRAAADMLDGHERGGTAYNAAARDVRAHADRIEQKGRP